MSKARNIADIGSHDVIETDSDGVTVTGVVQSANISATGALSNRNKIINGNFDIWQRGTSGSSGYVADRWQTTLSGSTAAITQQAFTLGQTDVPNEPTYFHRTVVTSSAGAGNFAITIQGIEGVRTLAGQTATLSFWAKADATKSIAVEFLQNFGTGGSPSASVTAIGVTTIALTTAWQKFTVTVSVPSISGKTLGTSGNDRLQLFIWLDAGSNYNSRTNSLGQQSGTFDIAQVQLEAGDTATPFEQRSYGQELALCERYFQTFDVFPATSFASFISYYGGSLALSPVQRLSTPMRALPTATIANASVQYYSFGQAWTNTTLGASVRSSELYYIYCSTDGDGRSKLMRNGSGGGAPNPVVSFSAEL